MGNREEELAKIHRYVMDNRRYFYAPHPEGLAWKRLGGAPQFYLDNPGQWELDLAQVEDLKEAERLRGAADARADFTISRGMSPETKHILDSIRRMHQEGRTPAEIARQLEVMEWAIRNVLAMGDGAYDTSSRGPSPSPAVNALTRAWSRSWPAGEHRNGNGSEHHKNGQIRPGDPWQG